MLDFSDWRTLVCTAAFFQFKFCGKTPSVSFQSFKERQSLEKARVYFLGVAEPVDLGLCPHFKT